MPDDMIAVASPTSYFLDDVVGVCSRCGRTVYTRPSTPAALPRVCAECFRPGPDDVLVTTRETLAELRAYQALFGARAQGRPS